MVSINCLSQLDTGDTSNGYGGLMRLRQAANHPLLRRKLYEDATVLKIAKMLCAKVRNCTRRLSVPQGSHVEKSW